MTGTVAIRRLVPAMLIAATALLGGAALTGIADHPPVHLGPSTSVYEADPQVPPPGDRAHAATDSAPAALVP